MRKVKIRNLSHSDFPALLADYCESFLCQLRGLTFQRTLDKDSGLLLVQGRESRWEAAIHMLFMWMDITAVWLNDKKQVVDICQALRWRPIYVPKAPAKYILELSPDWQQYFKVGDQIEFDDTCVN